MHKLKLSTALSLILLGASAEVFFYQYRFVSDGMSLGVAITIGVALTIMLMVASTFKNKSLALLLIIYSVIATSAGQSYSLELVRGEAQIVENRNAENRREYDRLQSNIDALTEEWNRLNDEKQDLSLADYSMWRTALANINERQGQVADDIKEFSRQQEALSLAVLIQPDDIYTYYSKLIGIPASILQFILQSMLSVFVALMAPVGINIWPKIEPQKTVSVELKDTPTTIQRQRMIDFVSTLDSGYLPTWQTSGFTKDEYKTALGVLKKIGAIKNTGGHWKIEKEKSEIIQKIKDY
jgi:hypothetical protein